MKFKQHEIQNLKADFQLSITSKDNEIKKLSMDLIAIKTGTLKNLEQKIDLRNKDFCNLKTDFYSNIASKEIVIKEQSKKIQQLLLQLNSNQVSIFEKNKTVEKQKELAHEDVERCKHENLRNDIIPTDVDVQKILQELSLPSMISPIPQLGLYIYLFIYGLV